MMKEQCSHIHKDHFNSLTHPNLKWFSHRKNEHMKKWINAQNLKKNVVHQLTQAISKGKNPYLRQRNDIGMDAAKGISPLFGTTFM